MRNSMLWHRVLQAVNQQPPVFCNRVRYCWMLSPAERRLAPEPTFAAADVMDHEKQSP